MSAAITLTFGALNRALDSMRLQQVLVDRAEKLTERAELDAAFSNTTLETQITDASPRSVTVTMTLEDRDEDRRRHGRLG